MDDGRAFGKRHYSLSSISSEHADAASTTVAPSKKHAKALVSASSVPLLQPTPERSVASKGGSVAECSSLEMLAQIATQQEQSINIQEATSPHIGAHATEPRVHSHMERSSATPVASPTINPSASEAMLANVVYAAQHNVHQLARRVHALEHSLY